MSRATPRNVMRVRHRLLLAACCVVHAGCDSSGRVDVRGTVTLDGRPLPGGVITFEPADKKGATAGGEITAGVYDLTGDKAVPPGSKVVRITGVMKTGRRVEVGPPAPPGTLTDEVIRIELPAKYNDLSTLRCEVVPGQINERDFALESE